VHIAVHNTATRGSDQALVTSSSRSLVTACKVVLAAPQQPANAKHSTRRVVPGEQCSHVSHSTTARTATALALQHTNITSKHYGGQVKLKTKPGEEEPADHLRRRRTSWARSKFRRCRTSRSQAKRSRQVRSKSTPTANKAVHSTTIAQLQAKGRKPACTSLIVHVPA
jgi:hypothetical protein